MSVAINPHTTVGALLEAYPQLESVLTGMAPAFGKLRNPIVRRTVAKVATLEQAAKVGGVSLRAMLSALRDAAGQPGPEPSVADAGPDAAGTPPWVAGAHIVEELDADAMLERGTHPIGRVRELVAALHPGDVVLLRSSFLPQPLIETMRRAGAAVHSSSEGGAWLTRFGRLPE